jgi:hypothetical protein
MDGLVVGGFLASSLYTSYEAKYFKMNKENSSEIYFRFKKIYEVIMKQIFKKALPICVWHKSVSASVCHDLLSKFGIGKDDRAKVIKNLGHTLLDELENLFRSYWDHRLGVSDGLLQVLGHSVRVKTQEIHGHQLQGPGHQVDASAY